MFSLGKYFDLVKFSHTIFALPFALTAMLIAADGLPEARVGIWIVVAMVSARTMAMTFNRIVDIRFDAENPRTRNRPTVTGEVSLPSAWVLWGLSSLLLFLPELSGPQSAGLGDPEWL